MRPSASGKKRRADILAYIRPGVLVAVKDAFSNRKGTPRLAQKLRTDIPEMKCNGSSASLGFRARAQVRVGCPVRACVRVRA